MTGYLIHIKTLLTSLWIYGRIHAETGVSSKQQHGVSRLQMIQNFRTFCILIESCVIFDYTSRIFQQTNNQAYYFLCSPWWKTLSRYMSCSFRLAHFLISFTLLVFSLFWPHFSWSFRLFLIVLLQIKKIVFIKTPFWLLYFSEVAILLRTSI